jgi:hypothetical protein
MTDPIIAYRSGPFPSGFILEGPLCSGVAAAPYEGVWVPFAFAKNATVELQAGSTGASADVWGTNQVNPTNTYKLTVAGALTTNDVINLVFGTQSGSVTVAYTVVAGDTTATILAGHLAAAINVSAALAALGVSASSSAAVITVTWPSVAPGAGTPEFQQPSSPPARNDLTFSYTAGGNTESITPALGTDGVNLTSAHLTTAAPGPIAPTPLPVRWIKARVTALSSGTAQVNVAGTA